MKSIFILFAILPISMACKQENKTDVAENLPMDQIESEFPDHVKENFTTEFSLDKNNSIVATITPGEGAYFASPKSKASLMGYANLELAKNDFIHAGDGFIESPASEKVYDSYSKGYINWVYEKTSYTYGTCRKVEEDFEVEGILSFVIEPECSRYEIGFVLINKDGDLSIQKTTTAINNLSN